MSIVDFKKLFISTLVLLTVPLLGLAQDSDGDSVSDDAEATADEEETPNIVVTGSRIKRTEFSSTAPIKIITNERSRILS